MVVLSIMTNYFIFLILSSLVGNQVYMVSQYSVLLLYVKPYTKVIIVIILMHSDQLKCHFSTI